MKKIVVIICALFCPVLSLAQTAPKILKMSCSHGLSDNVFSVSTDVPVTTVLEYGINNTDTTAVDKTLTTDSRIYLYGQAALVEGKTYQYRFIVTDTQGNSTTSQIGECTTNSTSNKAPVITQPNNISMKSNEVRSVTIAASDANNDNFTISVTNLPSFASYLSQANTLMISPTMSEKDVGSHTIYIKAQDSKGAVDTKIMLIEVSNSYSVPVISNLQVMQKRSDSIMLMWTTDVPAVSHIEYGKDDKYANSTTVGNSFDSKDMRKVHYKEITGLSAGAMYKLKAVSKTENGEGESYIDVQTLSNQETIEIAGGDFGEATYLLDKEGAYYKLNNDVLAQKTAFLVTKPNITLDLQGHTVVYANGPKDAISVPNNDFEEDLSVGWDASNAPHAKRDTDVSYLNESGKGMLHTGKAALSFTFPMDQEEYILSKTPIKLTAGYAYSLSMMAYNFVSNWTSDPVRVNQYILLVDAETGEEIEGTYSSRDVDSDLSRFYIGKRFKITEDKLVKIKIGVNGTINKSGVEGKRVTVDTVSLVVSNYMGIAFAQHYGASFSGTAGTFPQDVPVIGGSKTGFKLTSGKVIQGRGSGDGFSCEAIYLGSHQSTHAEVSKVYSEVYGVDCQNVTTSPYGSDGIYIHDNEFYDKSFYISDRHMQTGGNIQAGGKFTLVENNIIKEGSQMGISGCNNYSEIVGNYISNHQTATQSYNIMAGGPYCTIHNNEIYSDSGNGIMIGGTMNEIYDNTIELMSLPIQEYGYWNQSKCIEIREGSYISIYRNKLIAKSDVNHQGAHAMVFRATGRGNRIFDNYFEATSSSKDRVSAALRFYYDSPGDAVFANNTFASNMQLLMCAEGTCRGAIMKDNIWKKLPATGDVVFTSMSAGWRALGDENNFNFGNQYDNTYEGITNLNEAVNIYGGDGEHKAATYTFYNTGWSLGITVQDKKSLEKLADVSIIIKDSDGKEVFNNLTNKKGQLSERAYLIENKFYFPNGGMPAVYETTTYTPHTISLSKKGYYPLEQNIVVNKKQDLVFNLERNPEEENEDDLLPNPPSNIRVVVVN